MEIPLTRTDVYHAVGNARGGDDRQAGGVAPGFRAVRSLQRIDVSIRGGKDDEVATYLGRRIDGVGGIESPLHLARFEGEGVTLARGVADNRLVSPNCRCAGDGVAGIVGPQRLHLGVTRVHRKVRTGISVGVAGVIVLLEDDSMPRRFGFLPRDPLGDRSEERRVGKDTETMWVQQKKK